jgi:PQQ-dependent catabolism-associated CXXCW motif protein
MRQPAVGIVAVGWYALGLSALAAAAAPEPPGYRLDDYRAPVPASVAGGHVLHTDALNALIDRGGAVLIDVLPAPRRPEGLRPDAPWMPVPRRNIPGSFWLPDVGRGALNPMLEQWFQDKLAEFSGGDPDKPLVFYCLAECWMSWNAAKRAASYGYRNVGWYPEGTDGWHSAGLPLAVAAPEPFPQSP